MSDDPALHALGSTVAALWGQLSALRGELVAANEANGTLASELASIKQRLGTAEDVITTDAARRSTLSTMWMAHAPLRSRPLVSVVMPTFTAARAALLVSAVESVLAQSYLHWELLVVDNSIDGLFDKPIEGWPVGDPRVRTFRSDPHSPNAARNVALDHASGDLVAYLDDDCRWFPWWLHAAIASFDAAPDSTFVHGIRLSGQPGVRPGYVQAATVDPISLHIDNTVDTNTLVHRQRDDIRWDETLRSCTDYDLMVRLAGEPHEFVPVPACTYALGTPEQVWSGARHADNVANISEVRSRARRQRPLRIVAFNAFYPLISETYIGDELEALRRCGADIVLARSSPGPTECRSRIEAPMYESVQEAISQHDPDLVLCHWINAAKAVRDYATSNGIPHAVRLHSMCETTPNEEVFDEWCIGAWGPPHFDRGHPRAFRLPTLIVDPGPATADAGRSRSVLVPSAGLPKKNWGVLVEAVASLGVPLNFAMGLTGGWGNQPDVVRELLQEHSVPGVVDVDVDYDECQVKIRQAGAVVYSVIAGQPLGEARSVLEAAIAATPVVVPEGPSFRGMLGDTAHYYERGDVASLRAALESSLNAPHPEEARFDLSRRLRERHAAPEAFDQWTVSLTRALVDWRESRRGDQLWTERHWWTGRRGF